MQVLLCKRNVKEVMELLLGRGANPSMRSLVCSTPVGEYSLVPKLTPTSSTHPTPLQNGLTAREYAEDAEYDPQPSSPGMTLHSGEVRVKAEKVLTPCAHTLMLFLFRNNRAAVRYLGTTACEGVLRSRGGL